MTEPNDFAAILDRIAASTYTEADLQKLCELLQAGDRQNLIQLGKYNVNIGQGQNIHVGDHIYQGLDAETIRNVLLAALKNQDGLQRASVPFQAPNLPDYFVPRPEKSDELFTHLISEDAAMSGVLVVSAVYGLGGIGKTTLVAALAHDLRLQVHFPDGVLWATLGQQPELLGRLHDWVQALGDYEFRSTTLDGTSAHLRTLLHNKSCLLVVDDAWQAEAVRPFLVGSSGCRVVITTRDAILARKVGARLYDLDVMTEAQALALFEARLGKLNKQRVQATALAKELGYLPLALELAAAHVQDGHSWNELLSTFRKALADLAVLDLDEAKFRNESLRLSFRLSLEQLSPLEQEAFAWLGVLPEDTQINSQMATTLWNIPEAEARKRLLRFRNRALLKSVGDERYALHDLLHDEAKLRLADCLSLAQAQAALVERYRARCEDGQWHTLVDDGYIHAHLTWHMKQGGLIEAIHALLREETKDGKNGWYTACDRLGQPAIYLADLACAWQLADAAAQDPEQRATALPRQILYALCLASLTSLSANYPPELPLLALEGKVMTPVQALTVVRQMPDVERRAKALTAIAAHLPETLMAEALSIAQNLPQWIENHLENPRAAALIGLAPHLPLSLLSMALSATRTTDAGYKRAQVLCALATRLAMLPSPDLIAEAVDIATSIADLEDRAMALSSLAPYLEEPLLTQTWMEIIQKGHSHFNFPPAETLCALVPYLPELLLSQALEVVRTIRDERQRAEVLKQLIPRLPAPLLPQALDIAKTINDGYYCASALADLVPRLPEPLLPQTLDFARTIADGYHRAYALRMLVSKLTEPLKTQALSEALEAVKAIDSAKSNADAWHFASALKDLAPLLPESSLLLALDVARECNDLRYRIDAMCMLATHLPEQLKIQALAEAVDTARAIEDAYARAHALNDLLPSLAEPLKTQVLTDAVDAAKAMQSERWRACDLENLVSHLPQSLKVQALDDNPPTDAVLRLTLHLSEPLKTQTLTKVLNVTTGMWDEFKRSKALTTLAHHLPEQLKVQALTEVLKTVRSLESLDARAGLLVEIFPSLPETHRMQAVVELIDAVRIIGDADDRGFVLSYLALLLSGPMQALDVARTIMDRNTRVKALVKLARYIEPNSSEIMVELLDEAKAIEYIRHRIYRMANLVPLLPEPLKQLALDDMLEAVRRGDVDEWLFIGRGAPSSSRNRAFILEHIIIPHLPESLLGRALDVAETIPDYRWRAEVLSNLVPCLPEVLKAQTLAKALNTARFVLDSSDCIEALSKVAPHLAEPLRTEVLVEALEIVSRISEDSTDSWGNPDPWKASVRQAHALRELGPVLPEPLLIEALDIARSISPFGRNRAKALAGLAPYLPEPLQMQVLIEALDDLKNEWAVENEEVRVEALIHLAAHLTEPQKTQALLEALETVKHLPETTWPLYVGPGPELLVALAPHLPPPLLAHALDIAKIMRDVEDRYISQPRAYALKGLVS
jgi:hypothetical protein